MINCGINIIQKQLFVSILWFGSVSILGQTTAQISIPFEVYDNAGGQKTLFFGLDQTATDDIDINLGESDLPPYPPTGAFDARFILPENNFNGSLSSWRDYRNAAGFPFSDTIEHRIKYQSAGGATSMFFSWNFPPEVTGLLQDMSNGIFVNEPISGSGTYELTNFSALNQMKLFIYYNSILTGVNDENIKPSTFKLEQNFPNPFNPSTTIKYSVSENTFVNLSVYNMLGQRVVELVNEILSAGEYQIYFNASELASGIYLAKLNSDNFTQLIKMILTK
jgi:hypothetical protein